MANRSITRSQQNPMQMRFGNAGWSEMRRKGEMIKQKGRRKQRRIRGGVQLRFALDSPAAAPCLGPYREILMT